jgi:hypothetical protein
LFTFSIEALNFQLADEEFERCKIEARQDRLGTAAPAIGLLAVTTKPLAGT